MFIFYADTSKIWILILLRHASFCPSNLFSLPVIFTPYNSNSRIANPRVTQKCNHTNIPKLTKYAYTRSFDFKYLSTWNIIILFFSTNCTVQFVHFIISVQQMHNYLFTLTVNIQYTVQFVHFIISVQKMHNYLFTLTVTIQYTLQFFHFIISVKQMQNY